MCNIDHQDEYIDMTELHDRRHCARFPISDLCYTIVCAHALEQNLELLTVKEILYIAK